jgi:hypothetical protein
VLVIVGSEPATHSWGCWALGPPCCLAARCVVSFALVIALSCRLRMGLCDPFKEVWTLRGLQGCVCRSAAGVSLCWYCAWGGGVTVKPERAHSMHEHASCTLEARPSHM